MTEKIRILNLEGDNYQIGYQHGKALAKEIDQSIRLRFKHLKCNLNIDFEEAIREALKYLPNAENRLSTVLLLQLLPNMLKRENY